MVPTPGPPCVFARSVLALLFTRAVDFGALIGLTESEHMNYIRATWNGIIVG